MKANSVTVNRHKYDAGFKEEVLQMVFSGRPVSEVARSLGVGRASFTAGKAASRPGTTKGEEKALAAPDYEALHNLSDLIPKLLETFSEPRAFNGTV